MEYMLQYHEINFDSVTEIIDETTNYVAGVILTLDDVTVTDLDVIVKVTDFNPQAWSRIDLDVYTIDLRSNRRESIPSKENDSCAICHNELGASGDLNTLVCNHSYHHQCILGWIKMNLTCPENSTSPLPVLNCFQSIQTSEVDHSFGEHYHPKNIAILLSKRTTPSSQGINYN
ncbi:hypothetical protein BRARA_I01445 [Brassica rapa]|uniref:RING-type domain-containing protein n=1 Tax=Brassica campestris TaxID=3711 RepID=A0A397XTW1_BRACM|nr:hypothetical protein BRARA_I01445 [Brassica rapa]